MIGSLATYLVGGALGFAATLAILADAFGLRSGDQAGLIDWVGRNLGHSTWAFIACLVLFLGTLGRLRERLQSQPDHHEIVQLDQLSDVWIHLFIGIGVVWTAIGMRAALVTTLAVPESLANDADQVLARLVDGGILLALSTTIVGAIGGYLMRLFKTVSLGAHLSAFYHTEDRALIETALDRLKRIEGLLASIDQTRPTL